MQSSKNKGNGQTEEIRAEYRERLQTAEDVAARVQDGWVVFTDAPMTQPYGLMRAVEQRIADGELHGVRMNLLLDAHPYRCYTEELADKVVRLHVVANSDSDEDQALKLKVRDAVLEDMEALLSCGADVFYWEPQVYTPKALEAQLDRNPGVSPVLVLPAVMSSEELAEIHSLVDRHAEHFSGVVANNIGQFEPEWPVPVYGGQGLNVMNGESAAFYTALGAKRLTASCELSLKELRELQGQGGNYEMEVYGRAQLMLLSHCPRRTKAGDEKQDAVCNACAVNGGCPQMYTDRKGYRFPAKRLKMAHGCIVRLYNSMPTDMAKSAGKLHDAGISLRLSFTDEPLKRQREIVSSYRRVLDAGIAIHDMTQEATSGHLARGVE